MFAQAPSNMVYAALVEPELLMKFWASWANMDEPSGINIHRG